MTNYQESSLTSWDLVLIEIDNHLESVKQVTAFYEVTLKFRSNVNEIKVLGIDSSKNISGITDNKKEVVVQLNRHIINNTGVLHVYAQEKNDKELLKRISLSETKIKSQKQNKKIAFASIVIEELEKLPDAELSRFGLTKEDISDMKILRDDYIRLSPAKRKAVIDQSSNHAKMNNLFAENSKIKKNFLDKLIGLFIRKDPDFYRKYMAASVVIYKKSNRKNNKNGDVTIVAEEKK